MSDIIIVELRLRDVSIVIMATVCLVSFDVLVLAGAKPEYVETPRLGFIITLGYLLGRKERSKVLENAKYTNKTTHNADVSFASKFGVSKICNPKSIGVKQKNRSKKKRRGRRI